VNGLEGEEWREEEEEEERERDARERKRVFFYCAEILFQLCR